MKLIAMIAISAAMMCLSAQEKAAPKKAPAAAAKEAAPKAAAAKLLDINSASKEELEALPAIGKVKSAAIIAGRPFKSKDELVSKKIITAADYAKVKDLIIAKQK